MLELNSETIEASNAKPDDTFTHVESATEAFAGQCSWFRRLVAFGFRHSVRQGLVVLVDQSFSSVTRFLMGVLVARACAKAEYGLYVLGLSLILVAQQTQRGLTSNPFITYSPRLKGSEHAAYFGSTLVHQLIISALVSAGLAIAAGILYALGSDEGIAKVLIVLSIASGGLLLRDFIQSVLLAQLNVRGSLVMGLVANLGTLCLLLWAYATGHLSTATAYLIVAVCSGFPAIAVIYYKRQDLIVRWRQLGTHLRKNWGFGRWMLLAVGTNAVGRNAIPWLLLLWSGREGVAVFGVLAAFTGVLRPAIGAASIYITPKLSNRLRIHGMLSTIKVGLVLARGIGIPLFVYVVSICIFGDRMIEIVFTSRYLGYTLSLSIMAFAMAVTAVNIPLRALLRVMDHPETEFWSTMFASIVALLTSLCLIPTYGILGAAIANAACSVAFACTSRCGIGYWRSKIASKKNRFRDEQQ